jgi:GPI mannosyltransferase 2
VTTVLGDLGLCSHSSSFTIAGFLLSHLAHWLAVVLLWVIASGFVGPAHASQSSVALTAAVIHIVSPAGIFLSAPYAESTFAMLSFAGYVARDRAIGYFNRSQKLFGSLTISAAGLAFGLATLVRSNGILAGIPFLLDALTILHAILIKGVSLSRCCRLLATVLGGLLIAAGIVVPNAIGYQEYCYGRSVGERRDWCNRTVPSIFTFVQSHYW